FTPLDDGVGVLVVSIDSPADGGVGEFTAQKVVFTVASPTTSAGAFYGVQGGVIERFDATGTPQGPLAGSAAHGTVAEVQQVAGTLYFTAGTTNCASSLYSMSTSGGASTSVADADAGYGITGFSLTADGRPVFFESGCGGNAGSGKLVFPTYAHGPQGRAIDFPRLP